MADFLNVTDAEIDVERAASAFPDISLDGASDIPPLPTNASIPLSTSGFTWDDFDAPSQKPARPVKVTGDDDLEKFENMFPDIDGGSAPPPPLVATTYVPPVSSTTTTTFAPRPQPSAYTPILSQPPATLADEPQVIREWREEQAKEINARDEAAKIKRQETVSKAERAIDAFYEEYTAKRTKTISENKEEEIEFERARTEALAAGTTWSRICDLLDLQNSQSKTNARTGPGTTDLTRYKEVLLRLRREGESAPGAGGY